MSNPPNITSLGEATSASTLIGMIPNCGRRETGMVIVSEKLECPACDTCTLNVMLAYRRGEACPHCALSHEAMIEILEIRNNHDSAELITRCEELIKKNDGMNAELAESSRKIESIRGILGS